MNEQTGELTDTTNRATLFAKMARVMGKMDRLKKTGYNQQQKYQFATDADVADLVRQAMVEEGLAFFASMTSYEQSEHTTSGGSKMTRTVATFLFTFCCTETGATESRTWSSESLDSGDKGMNKAATAAEKFFLLKTFIISTGDKADEPDYHSPEFSQDKPAQPKKQNGTSKPTPPSSNPPPDSKSSTNGAHTTTPAKGVNMEVHTEAGVITFSDNPATPKYWTYDYQALMGNEEVKKAYKESVHRKNVLELLNRHHAFDKVADVKGAVWKVLMYAKLRQNGDSEEDAVAATISAPDPLPDF